MYNEVHFRPNTDFKRKTFLNLMAFFSHCIILKPFTKSAWAKMCVKYHVLHYTKNKHILSCTKKEKMGKGEYYCEKANYHVLKLVTICENE